MIYKQTIAKIHSSAICSLCDVTDQEHYDFHIDGLIRKLRVKLTMCKKLSKVEFVYWSFAKFLKSLNSLARFYSCKKGEIGDNLENLISNAIDVPLQLYENCSNEVNDTRGTFLSRKCLSWCETRLSSMSWEDSAHLVSISDFIHRSLSVYFLPETSDYYTNSESQKKLVELLKFNEIQSPLRICFLYPDFGKFIRADRQRIQIEIISKEGIDLFDKPLIVRSSFLIIGLFSTIHFLPPR